MNERIGARDRARQAGERTGGERVVPERATRGRVTGRPGLLSALLGAAALVIAGCGQNAADRAPAESHAQVETSTPQPAVAAVPASQEAPASGAMMTEGTGAADGLPPEIAASVTDTLVVPGQPVEIEVEATSDVSQIALSDGRGDPLPFVRDSTGNAWRVGYRVPLRPREDRLGLSVTAHNQSNRWRRVWVFLHVQRPEAEQRMEGDSLGGTAK
jgi:hypothetical protein